MLELRPSCEQCAKALPANSTEAMICSFECTFCHDCVKEILQNVCPNCGGGFWQRPIRPQREYCNGVSLRQYPISNKRIFKPVEPEQHNAFANSIKNIKPENR